MLPMLGLASSFMGGGGLSGGMGGGVQGGPDTTTVGTTDATQTVGGGSISLGGESQSLLIVAVLALVVLFVMRR